MSYSLYAWNAPKLIQGALNAYQRDPVHAHPIDRDLPEDPHSALAPPQIPDLTPIRYDDAGDGSRFAGMMNLGSYQTWGSDPVFGQVDVPLPAIKVVPKEKPVPLTAGLEGEYAGLGYALDFMNLLSGGYIGRADERMQKSLSGEITQDEMLQRNMIDFAATTGAFVVSGALATGLKVSLTFKGFKAVLAESALRGAATMEIFNIIEQAGANVIYLASDGKEGHLGVNLWELAGSTLFGAAFGTLVSGTVGIFTEREIRAAISKAFRDLANRVTPNSPARAATPRGNSLRPVHETPIEITGKSTIRLNGVDVCETPSRKTLTYDQAEQWYAEKVKKIAEWLAKSPNESLAEKVSQARQLQEELLEGAKASLLDSSTAREFLAAHRLPPNELLQTTLAKEMKSSGDALENSVLQRMLELINETICFVAGTPVWTDKGLVSIEKLKVGDLVLSKSDVSGEKAYKRVLKTFRTENQEIRTINFVGPITEDGAESRREYLFVTPGHPFWIKDRGWMTVDEICNASRANVLTVLGWHLERANGNAVEVCWPDWTVGFPLIQLLDAENHAFLITDPNKSDGILGYTMRFDGQTQMDDFDPVDRDFVPGRRVLFHGATCTGDDLVRMCEVIDPEDQDRFKTTVYNIEVEDFHTYFVGELGVWVHNTCAPKNHVNSWEAMPRASGRTTILPEGLNLKTPSEASEYAKLHEYYGKIVKVKTEINSNTKGALEWNDGVYGALVEAGNPKQAVELFVTFLNKDAVAYGRGFFNGRSYEGATQVGDRLYLTDRKQEFWNLIGLPNSPYLSKVNIPDTIASLWKDCRAIEAVESAGGYANVKDIGVAYSFKGDFGWRQAVDDFILPLLRKDYRDPAKGLQETFQIKYDKTKTSPEIRIPLDENIARLEEVAENILNKKIILVTKDGVLKFERAGSEIKWGIEKNDPLLKSLTNDNFQLVEQEGSHTTTSLTQTQVDALLPAARQYWRDLGASETLLNNARLEIAHLATGVAGQTEGSHIQLDANGAGWGWYIDPNPTDSSEFTATATPTEFVANLDSPAAGKLDLLTVLIHELGHVLGLEHAADTHDEMTATVTPGLRRLPDIDAGQITALGWGAVVTSPRRSSRTLAVAVPQYDIAAHPQLTNPTFNDASGWSTQGSVTFTNHSATLKETPTTQTRLNQVFKLGPNDRYLSFTLSGISLDDVSNAPDDDQRKSLWDDQRKSPPDAFEVALIDANSGRSLLGSTGLSHNDALINLQADEQQKSPWDGTKNLAAGVSTVTNADGSRHFVIDLAGIAQETVANLSFDLIGFGRGAAACNSQLTIRDLELGAKPGSGSGSSAPQAINDTLSLDEDSTATLNLLANDRQLPAKAQAISLTQPSHGTLTSNPDGTLRYTPDPDWHGSDRFTYRIAIPAADDETVIIGYSDPATVSTKNDAPVAMFSPPFSR